MNTRSATFNEVWIGLRRSLPSVAFILVPTLGCDTTSKSVNRFDEGTPVPGTSVQFSFEEGAEIGLRSPNLSRGQLAHFEAPWSGSPEVVVRTLDGEPVHSFSVERGTASLDWAPDGERVAFAAGFTVFTARPDGSELRRIGAGVEPQWSPDGRRIAFVRTVCVDPPDPPACGIVLASDSESDGTLPVNPVPYGGSPAWHPNGVSLYHSVPLPQEGMEAVGVSTIGAGGLALETKTLPYTHRLVRRLDVSPDGLQVVFTAEDGTWVAATDGSGERLVLPASVEGANGSGNAAATLTGGASWTPDGRLIYDLFRASRYGPSPIAGGASADGVLTLHVVDLSAAPSTANR